MAGTVLLCLSKNVIFIFTVVKNTKGNVSRQIFHYSINKPTIKPEPQIHNYVFKIRNLEHATQTGTLSLITLQRWAQPFQQKSHPGCQGRSSSAHGRLDFLRSSLILQPHDCSKSASLPWLVSQAQGQGSRPDI